MGTGSAGLFYDGVAWVGSGTRAAWGQRSKWYKPISVRAPN